MEEEDEVTIKEGEEVRGQCNKIRYSYMIICSIKLG